MIDITILILLLICGLLYCIWKINKLDKYVNDYDVKYPNYTQNNSYKNISILKNNIFLQLTIDLTVAILLNYLTRDKSTLISFKGSHEFFSSIIGTSLLTSIGFVIFYEYLQPKILNAFPNF
jgi:hypothetical protein